MPSPRLISRALDLDLSSSFSSNPSSTIHHLHKRDVLSHQAVIVIVILAMGFGLLCAYACFRFFFQGDSSNSESANSSVRPFERPTDDQGAYMRSVRRQTWKGMGIEAAVAGRQERMIHGARPSNGGGPEMRNVVAYPPPVATAPDGAAPVKGGVSVATTSAGSEY